MRMAVLRFVFACIVAVATTMPLHGEKLVRQTSSSLAISNLISSSPQLGPLLQPGSFIDPSFSGAGSGSTSGAGSPSSGSSGSNGTSPRPSSSSIGNSQLFQPSFLDPSKFMSFGQQQQNGPQTGSMGSSSGSGSSSTNATTGNGSTSGSNSGSNSGSPSSGGGSPSGGLSNPFQPPNIFLSPNSGQANGFNFLDPSKILSK